MWSSVKTEVDKFFYGETIKQEQMDKTMLEEDSSDESDDDMPYSCAWYDEDELESKFDHYASKYKLEDGAKEVNYDVNPTPIYKYIEGSEWDRVLRRCESHPGQVGVWVYRTETSSATIRWKLLPIHAALVFGCPATVLRALLDAYPEGARERDDQGQLPIHLAFKNRASDQSLTMLLNEYPESISVRDSRGRVPIDVADSNRRWIKYLDNRDFVTDSSRDRDREKEAENEEEDADRSKSEDKEQETEQNEKKNETQGQKLEEGVEKELGQQEAPPSEDAKEATEDKPGEGSSENEDDENASANSGEESASLNKENSAGHNNEDQAQKENVANEENKDEEETKSVCSNKSAKQTKKAKGMLGLVKNKKKRGSIFSKKSSSKQDQ